VHLRASAQVQAAPTVAKLTLLALNTVLRESSSGCLTLPDFVAADFACVSTLVLLKVVQSSVTHVLASGIGDRIESVSMPFWPCRLGAVCTDVVARTPRFRNVDLGRQRPMRQSSSSL